jgi:hypothetical protein
MKYADFLITAIMLTHLYGMLNGSGGFYGIHIESLALYFAGNADRAGLAVVGAGQEKGVNENVFML